MDQTKARDALLAMRRDYERTIAELKERLADSQRESGGEISSGVDQHPADAATETADRELDASREAMFEARLRQIDEALARIEQGTYGRCAVCGRPIPDERLEIMPDTPYCVADAQREQRHAAARAQ